MIKSLLVNMLLFTLAFSIILFHKSTKDFCIFDRDCEWEIINCCTEQEGAKWECVNIKSFIELECPKYVICPKIISPKPNLSCKCKEGRCVVG
ncbi:MAG: hypothetical protein QW423_01140 [Candidatus Aenigmatarchaeota archaeon]